MSEEHDWVAGLLSGIAPAQLAGVASVSGAPVSTEPGAEDFCCLLDTQPAPLVPRHLLAEARKRKLGRQLIVNPRCCFSRGSSIRMPFIESASPNHETVWVLDPATDAVMPFWLGPRFRDLLTSVRPGQPEPAGLSLEERFVLAMASVLVDPDHTEQLTREHARMVKRSARQFHTHRYVPLHGLVHPFHLAALRSYYRQQIRDGKLRLGDSQTPRRYLAHNEKVACFFHHQLTAIVSSIAGEPVKPSYVYVVSYQPGARLPRHTDRPQCEFSISLCLDFTPEREGRTSWPLCFETEPGTLKIVQSLGEGLLYRGCELPHFRTMLPKNCTSTSIFFHYVHRDFSGPLV
jgi:hypothetical protein